MDSAASHADITFRFVGANGIGKSAEMNDLGALVIVGVKAIFLLKAETVLFLLFVENTYGGVEPKIILHRLGRAGILGGGIIVQKIRRNDLARKRTVLDKILQAEKEKSDECYCRK